MTNKINAESICVVCDNETQYEKAAEFATLHQLNLFDKTSVTHELQLKFSLDKIELFDKTLKTSVFVDFLSGAQSHREKFGGGKGQAIAKAIGLNKPGTPNVLDLTAGLARDAYVLATLGCQMTLIEQSPILCMLINDGINRALLAEDKNHSVSNFTQLINTNSQHYLEHLNHDSLPDVIYIDPMYPERKKSALVKKDMQILHKLIGSNKDEENLLIAALDKTKHRVVIKRPIHARPVAGITPSMNISSKKTRYDVYVITKS